MKKEKENSSIVFFKPDTNVVIGEIQQETKITLPNSVYFS